jgi:hypothetical protein
MATVSKLTSAGNHSITGEYDEYNLTNSSYAVQFNGARYLTTSATPGVAAITTDFTVEFWMYVTSGAGTNRGIAGQYKLATGRSWLIYLDTSNQLGILWQNSSFGSGAGSISLNTWYHVAWVRNGANLYGYLNGVQFGSSSVTTIPGSSDPILFGGNNDSASPVWLFTGYLSNFRIVKETAVYTAAFTPPYSPLTNITNTSLLTLQNPIIIDNGTANTGGTGFVISNPTSATTLLPSPNWMTTKNKQFSNGTLQTLGELDEYNLPNNNYAVYYSGVFNGTNAYAQVTPYSANFDLNVSSWTMEAWIQIDAGFTSGHIIARDTFGSNWDWNMGITPTQLNLYTGNTARNYTVTTGITLQPNVWYHIAFVRNAGTVHFYINGVRYGAGSTMVMSTNGATGPTIGCAGWNAPSGFFKGKISNLRIVKNQALYTDNFNPPLRELTTTTVGTTGANVATSLTGTVSLLMCRSPLITTELSSGLTVTGGSGSYTTPTVTVTNTDGTSPLTGTVSRQYNSGRLSILGEFDEYTIPNSSYAVGLNGSSNLTIPYNTTAFSFDANFTIEFWANYTGHGTYGGFVSWAQNGSGWGGYQITFDAAANNIRVEINSSIVMVSSVVMYPYVWNHVALVRNGTGTNNIKLYLNGVTVAQATSTATFAASSGTTMKIGSERGPVAYVQGLMSNLRIVKGTAVYTSDFTPSSEPLPTITNTTLLTCQSPTIVDNSTSGLVISNPSSMTATNIPTKFYTGRFTGSSYLTVADNAALQFGSGDWTIEFWLMMTSFATYYSPFSKRATTAGFSGVNLVTNGAGTMLLFVANATATAWSLSGVATGFTLSLNTMYHIAIVRSGSTITAYLDGVAGTPQSFTGAIGEASSPEFSIMAGAAAGGQSVPGYMSNFRYVKRALYTTSFTPPYPKLTNVANTVLLTLQSPTIVDNSDNHFTITPVNSPTIVPPIF